MANTVKSGENDLTQGNVAKQLIKFAVPFIISSLILTTVGMLSILIIK